MYLNLTLKAMKPSKTRTIQKVPPEVARRGLSYTEFEEKIFLGMKYMSLGPDRISVNSNNMSRKWEKRKCCTIQKFYLFGIGGTIITLC